MGRVSHNARTVTTSSTFLGRRAGLDERQAPLKNTRITKYHRIGKLTAFWYKPELKLSGWSCRWRNWCPTQRRAPGRQKIGKLHHFQIVGTKCYFALFELVGGKVISCHIDGQLRLLVANFRIQVPNEQKRGVRWLPSDKKYWQSPLSIVMLLTV